MKSLVLILAALTVTVAYAKQRIPFVQVDTYSVKCRSGAPVNFAETLRRGEQVRTAVLPPEFKRVDEFRFDHLAIFHLDYPIKNETGYKSGQPPCPVADVLELEVTIQNCAIIVSDDYGNSFECGEHEMNP